MIFYLYIYYYNLLIFHFNALYQYAVHNDIINDDDYLTIYF